MPIFVVLIDWGGDFLPADSAGDAGEAVDYQTNPSQSDFLREV
jgi:hypothetical protein